MEPLGPACQEIQLSDAVFLLRWYCSCQILRGPKLTLLIGEDLRAAVSQNGAIRANVSKLQRKASEQRKIIRSADDVRILKKAFASFKSLQFVKLLPVAEEEDRRFREYVQIHGSVRDFINHYWAPAIIHGSKTVGAALLAADAPWSRLYLPVESVESVEFLALRSQPTLSILAARLTCLTLVFDEGNELGEEMGQLSELFKVVFASARNMQAVHIGFPRSRPVSLPLEAVFHNVTWDKVSILLDASILGISRLT
jgi:hypothetical protein